MEEEEEEEEEEEQVSEGSTEWEPIHFPHHRHRHHHLHSTKASHHRSLSDSQTQFRGWSMVASRDSPFDDEDDCSIVFPPINHEGLHISSTPSSSLSNHDDQQHHRKSSNSPCENNGLVPPPLPAQPPPPDTKSGVGGEVARWVGFGFELLRSKVTSISSSLRYFAAFRGTNWSYSLGTNRSYSSATGLAAALLVWWLFVAILRRRRHSRVRKESRDHLIVLIKEKDEKINQLLHQIAQMNQVLISLHRDSSSATGG